jgi:hypothetical protein
MVGPPGGSAGTGRKATPRDLRLDFFRGVALVFIFLDHIPSNVLNWLTIRNFGFSDATEMFVFISGYSAMLAYGGRLQADGFGFTAARILKRCWQLYVAQLLLFVAYTAQVAYTAATFSNPMFSEEMGIVAFFDMPHIALLQAMLLKFRPTNTDVLPLYIVLLALFPLILSGLKRSRWPLLAASAALYLVAGRLDWNLPSWPHGAWYFNPLCWQFLFIIGAAFGMEHGRGLGRLQSGWVRRLVVVLACGDLLFALAIVMSWRFPAMEVYVPGRLQSLLYPVSKTNLDILRLAHFLALAYLVVLLVPAGSRFLTWRVAAPLIRCGQHSLEIFCLGVFLSFTGHMLLVEFSSGLPAQVAVSLAGIALMIAMAYYLSWYRRSERRAAAARTSPPSSGGGS